MSHIPVMLNEVIAALNIQPDGMYLDGTLGRAGHSQAILEKLGPQGRLICLDKDPQAIAYAQALFQDDPRVIVVHQCFSKMTQALESLDLLHQINGVLLDLGVSSPQLDEDQRGFSFMREGPLDMRMDPTQGISAAQWLAKADHSEIQGVLKNYGEEPFASRIAKKIVEERQTNPIVTTLQLADLIRTCVPVYQYKHHPATKTFQAIRIYINQELDALDSALQQSWDILAPGGRLAILSFHSLEDRKVKQFFRARTTHNLPRGLAIREQDLAPLEFSWVLKRERAQAEEIALNPRARSATLRVLEKNR